ncbi:transformation/transcription domain-associated protein-like [Leptopilina heterotoma]|uniref:transformation/transcription domain-associated protein-like n=1 Tax=Leptopilina heterotoma TaxID=63436 RepID=UPI001CA96327|nr:transformation/transcription domain-associated protein-like [Leptopilina heterotoma]
MDRLNNVARTALKSQINTYLVYVNCLGDASKGNDVKLRSALEISESLDIIVLLPQYPIFLARFMKIIKPILLEGTIQFISEYSIHQTRKVILEILYRLPTDEYLKPYVSDVLKITLQLLEIDNEENSLICLQIMSEYRKKYKPTSIKEVLQFLEFVKKMYTEFTNNFVDVIQAKSSITIRNLVNLNIESSLAKTYIVTAIHTNQKDEDGNLITYNLIPRTRLSLKFLQKVPSFLITLRSLYKQQTGEIIMEIVSLLVTLITLKTCDPIPDCNREILYEFVGLQVKCLMLVSYNIKDFIDIIFETSATLFKGVVDLLRACPTEATHFRKEIFIYFRYLILSKFQRQFISHIDQLLDEELLFGSGFTANETLRSFAFNVIADFIHQVRNVLSFSHLTRVVNFFSRLLNDARLPVNIENLSCKLLNNLIQCVISRSESEDYFKGRKLLQKILEVFVLKLETIVKDVIPIFASAKTFTKTSQNLHQNIVEYKNIIRWIILGVKEIVIFNFSDKFTKQFEWTDVLLFLRFFKWGMKSFNLYTIGRLAMDAIPKKTNKLIQFHETKLKEEKQLVKCFATIFMSMDLLTFETIFTGEIDFIVNQVIGNRDYLAIINYLLLDPGKSLVFGNIMIEYLLEKMDQVGSKPEISDLYLTLFKTIFGSVAFSPEENREILRSNLHKIVKRSLDLAVNAKEPLNYFLILRALYRSISGGTQEILYQEFLPLLSKLIEDLNRFQTEFHKQEIHEIVLELFLSIPVRIGFLLPYFEKLMITIVHALNGNDVLIGDGLKILDICINSVDFSFSQDYLQIVATDLIESLFRIVRESKEELAQKAFEILGKLGGESRKVLINPQKLRFVNSEIYPSVRVSFENSVKINLSVKKIIETAYSTLNSTSDLFYKQQAWKVINSYLSATVKLEDDKRTLINLFNHPRFKEEIFPTSCCVKEDLAAKEIQKIALSGLFIAAAEETSLDSNLPVFETMLSYVRHYTMIFVAQEVCSNVMEENKYKAEREIFQNPLVLIDALKDILKYEKKEFFKVASNVLETILKTATSIVGSLQRVCQLPFMEYLFEKLTSLCYENPWYSKLGGCMVIEFLIQKMPLKWLLTHLLPFVKALCFVISDLNEGIGSGTIGEAKANLNKLLRVCFEQKNSDLETTLTSEFENEHLTVYEVQKNETDRVVRELMLFVSSPRTILRKEAMNLLSLLAELRKVPLTDMIRPHREIVADLVPPMKIHMVRHPIEDQIGIIDANGFFLSFTSLFVLDISLLEHKSFYEDLVQIIEREDNQLLREPCYKDLSDFIPLKTTALRTIIHFYSIETLQENVITIFISALKKIELQETALECLKKIPISEKMKGLFFEPVKKILAKETSIDLNFLTYFSYLVEIFPTSNYQFCNSLILYLGTCFKNLKTEYLNRKIKEEIKKDLENKIRELEKKLLEPEAESSTEAERQTLEESRRKNTEEKRIIITNSNVIQQQILTILQIFQKTTIDLKKFIPTLCRFFLQSEKDLMNQIQNPFKVPFTRYLSRYPSDTVDFLLNHNSVRCEEYGLFLEFLLNSEQGEVFKETLKSRSIRLMQMFLAPQQPDLHLAKEEKMEIRFRAIRLVSILIDYDENWFTTQTQLITVIKQIWYKNEYINYHKDIENVKSNHLVEPEILLKVFIHYLEKNPEEFDFLFNILKIFRINFVSNVTMLSDFIEKVIAQTYHIQWKRTAFSKFIYNFQGKRVSDELKADILHNIVYKCFEASFKKKEVFEIIGTPPSPNTDDPRNLISIFINKVIDIDNPGELGDRLRVGIFRFACLLVDHAGEYIHDVNIKHHGIKLKTLVYFAWSCLLNKNCVDPITKYHGHLLLSHIIRKFSVSKSIVVHVFLSLMQAHSIETKHVVKEALDILIPIFPHRMESGYSKLAQLTRKVLIEESHSRYSLSHCLQFVVKHFKVYYSVRYHLIPILVNSIKKITEISTIDSKKLAVDIAETIIEWEIQAKSEETSIIDVVGIESSNQLPDEGSSGFRRIVLQNNTPLFTTLEPQPIKRLGNFYIDKILNFILKLTCEVHDVNTLQGIMEEQLVKRSANLIKRTYSSEVWVKDGNVDFSWMNKTLAEQDSEKIYRILELLIFLVRGLGENANLHIFTKLESGLTMCLSSDDRKILKYLQEILSNLLTIFPIDPILTKETRDEKMKLFYKFVRVVFRERLTGFERNEAGIDSLAPCVMIAKTVYLNNAGYLDPVLTNLLGVFQKISRFHLAGVGAKKEETELLTFLDILSNRFEVMSTNNRRKFLTSLGVLIDNTPNLQIIRIIIKLLKNWVKDEGNLVSEKFPIFIKMWKKIQNFPADLDLRNNFLDVLCLMYQNRNYRHVKLSTDLELAFLEGLRSSQPHTRIKFSKIMNAGVERSVKDRLRYISEINWQLMGRHYWIKQCVEFVLIVVDPTTRIQVTQDILLPSVKFSIKDDENPGLNLSDLNEALSKLESSVDLSKLDSNVDLLNLKSTADLLNSEVDESNLDLLNDDDYNMELFNLYPSLDLSNLDMNLDLSNFDLSYFDPNTNLFDMNIIEGNTEGNSNMNLTILDTDILDTLQTPELDENIPGASEINPQLTEFINKHIKFLDYLKSIRTEEFLSATIQLCHKESSLAADVWKDIFPQIWSGEIDLTPFLCDKSHLVQKDCQPSAIVTFCEALVGCEPEILKTPRIINYLGKTFNVWHQMTLRLEEMIVDQEKCFQIQENNFFDFDDSDTNYCLEILDSLTDLYSRLEEDDMWSGLWQKHSIYKETVDAIAFEQQGFLKEAQETYSIAVEKLRTDLLTVSLSKKMQSESELWEKRWIRCAKELNQWDLLLNKGKTELFNDPLFIFEICFLTSDWSTMKEYLEINKDIPSDQLWKIELYRGYLSTNGEEKNLPLIDEHISNATKQCIREWKKLPRLISRSHFSLLQAAEKIADLRDAKFIHENLDPNQTANLRKIIYTWTQRVPTIADDLSHWSNIFIWREYQYKSLIAFATSIPKEKTLKYYIHTWAQSVNNFSKIARKQNLSSVALDSLTRIHKIESIPITDCFERIKQQVKCYLKMFTHGEENRLKNALDCMESIETQYFEKKITSDFYSLKGKLYTLFGESDKANQIFSKSIKINEKNSNAWGLWGEYFESVFQTNTERTEYTKSAVSCFLNALKYSGEEKNEKCRKYIAKILWLLNYDDEEMNLFKSVNRLSAEIYPVNWVSFIPQLLKWLLRPPGGEIIDLLNIISRIFPQPIYSQLWTLYMELQFKKLNNKNLSNNDNSERNLEREKEILKSINKCSQVMRRLLLIYPKLLSYLERTFDQISMFKENWLHGVVKRLQEILILSYRVAFDNKENINEVACTQEIIHHVGKLTANVRVEMEKIFSQNTNFGEYSIFGKINKEFEQDFKLDSSSDKLLMNLIKRLKKWIVILENNTKASLRSFLLEKKCQSLSNFNFQNAEIGLPGSTLLPKFSHYPVTIVKFMPWVEVIQHKFSIAHRISILGSDGKPYVYLIVSNDQFIDFNRNYRVLQLLQMLNLNLQKQKETCRRFLQFTIPKMIPLNPHVQLIEDNPNAIDILQIYKQNCEKRNILPNAPISKYYELISSIAARRKGVNMENLMSIFKEVQKNLIPKTILKDWAVTTFPSSMDYWTFRKMFISQISLVVFSQYVFHLTKLCPDMMNLNLDSGIINVNYFTFDLHEAVGKLGLNELVPFRLTPNIAEFVTDIGISGPLRENIIASARCLAQPSYQIKSLLQAIIRDEFSEDRVNQSVDTTFVETNKEIIRRVIEVVTSISTRLNSLGHFSGIDSNVRNFLNNSRNVDNLCQMDPYWYPWL